MKSSERDGPQEITVHGRPAAMVVSAREYARLRAGSTSLVSFIRKSPLYGADDVEVARDPGHARKVRL